mgnify:CR=1 FL=1
MLKCILTLLKKFNIIYIGFNNVKAVIGFRGALEEVNMENEIPKWIMELDENDYTFMKNFILASGSLKELAKQYNISYPTVRSKLDKLIKKIEVNDTNDSEYIHLIKNLAIEGKLSSEAAKILINEFRKNYN